MTEVLLLFHRNVQKSTCNITALLVLQNIQLQIKQYQHCITTDMTPIHVTMLTGKGNTFCNAMLKEKYTIKDNSSTVHIVNILLSL